ncbi:DUF6194 family protein [Saccharothrix yanglingensis]|uniref:DUF6194 domain-containing protein n=1 Tax=Saccharothrix yanglingensis TaxID=659496 RepID=A0ABU0X499_9PSEU|nr:DUF6194 family protein [Saccharothrix yanglingensis]MDQ2586961.1 hypothetical protein [Saccharothrix yanglingensis]
MDAERVTRYIDETFDGVRAPEANGDTFFLYDPDGDLPPERQVPFATIVTGDAYDDSSALDGTDDYRLNIGLTRAGYAAVVGSTPGEVDHAARDVLMPHPVYAGLHWVCVVSPSDATFEAVRPLLAEAHAFAARKHANHARRADVGRGGPHRAG